MLAGSGFCVFRNPCAYFLSLWCITPKQEKYLKMKDWRGEAEKQSAQELGNEDKMESQCIPNGDEPE
jgi:hypothetical protein